MALITSAAESAEPNHPASIRMAVIASLTFNIVIGSIFGSPGVLLKPMREHLGVTTEMVSLGSLAVIIGSAVSAPQIGALVARTSLRNLLALASVLMAGAWLLVAFTTSYVVFLIAYGLMLGPVMALGASILPPTLVTRWFNRNRGLAIGLVHLPIVVAAMPVVLEWVVSHHGLRAGFLMLAALPLAVLLPASLFIIDRPPGQVATIQPEGAPTPVAKQASLTVFQLLRQPRYWALCLAAGVANTSSTMLGVHLVSMAESWGVARIQAAGLASIMSALGMAGSILLGVLADRIGGGKTLVVIALGDAVLWSMFLLGLPYAGLAATVGLIGVLGSGTVPAMSKMLADSFGRESFSRAIGLMVPVTLPLLFIGLIAPGAVVRITGSYTVVVLGMVAAFAAAALLALAATASPRRS